MISDFDGMTDVEIFVDGRKIGSGTVSGSSVLIQEKPCKSISDICQPISISMTLGWHNRTLRKLIKIIPVDYQLEPKSYAEPIRGPRNRWGGLK